MVLGLGTEHCLRQRFQLGSSGDLPLHLLPQQEGLEAGGEAGGPRHLLHLPLGLGQTAVDSDVGDLAVELMECRVPVMVDHTQGEEQSGRGGAQWPHILHQLGGPTIDRGSDHGLVQVQPGADVVPEENLRQRDLLQDIPERVLYVGPENPLPPEPNRHPGNLVIFVLLRSGLVASEIQIGDKEENNHIYYSVTKHEM